VETLAFGYGLPEGPRADAAGNLTFSDAIGGGVFRRSPDGEITTVIPKRRGIGGLVPHADGGLVVTGKDVSHVRDGVTRVLLRAEGVVGWNDLTTDREGRVYVGSLRSGMTEREERIPGELWRIETEGAAAPLFDGIGWCNGVGFSPDERTIYLSDYAAGAVIAHDVEDGACVNRRVFAKLDGKNPVGPRFAGDLRAGHPDGLAVDEAGCVWVAGGDAGAVLRFTPEGRLDRSLDVPAGFVASLCFGGADRRDLYITTMDNTEKPERAGTVFRSRADVPGVPVPPARV
jgi:gluconolactonase